MSNQDMSTERTKLERKLIRERGLDEADKYISELDRLNKEELETRLLDLSKTGQGLINTKNADEELQNLRAKVSEMSRVHNDSIRRNKDHQRLVSIIISERFGDELMDLKVESEDAEELKD